MQFLEQVIATQTSCEACLGRVFQCHGHLSGDIVKVSTGVSHQMLKDELIISVVCFICRVLSCDFVLLRLRLSPAARHILDTHGLDPHLVKATGPRGLITKE